MKIVSIGSSRFPLRVNLVFDNGLMLPFLVDNVFVLKLKKNVDIDNDLFEKIQDLSIQYLLNERALRLIAFSPKSEKKIYQKLKISFREYLIKYKFPKTTFNVDQIINLIIEALKEKSFINDSKYIEYFIRTHTKKSRRYIEESLKSEGISSILINEYLSAHVFNDKEEINNLIIKKKITIDDLKDYKNKNKLIAHFYRKGFSLSDIQSSFDDIVRSG